MSNVFTKGTAPFYSVPQALIASGRLRTLSEGAHKLYQAILYKAQQGTRTGIELSNAEIRDLVGLSPNTIRRGRTQLVECGLVELRGGLGDIYTYVVLNPLTGARLPGRGSAPTKNDNPTTPLCAPSWNEIG